MSSSSLFSASSSSSSSSSSSFSSPPFPSPVVAASRQRRKRRDAISRAAESDWDASPSTTSPPPSTSTHDIMSIPTWHTDELICPLAPSSVPLPPSTFMSLAPPTDEDVDDLQAMLARFTFPSSPPSSRKHRRSGESIDLASANVNATVPGTNSGRGTGPVRRAPCAHCAYGPTSM